MAVAIWRRCLDPEPRVVSRLPHCGAMDLACDPCVRAAPKVDLCGFGIGTGDVVAEIPIASVVARWSELPIPTFCVTVFLGQPETKSCQLRWAALWRGRPYPWRLSFLYGQSWKRGSNQTADEADSLGMELRMAPQTPCTYNGQHLQIGPDM